MADLRGSPRYIGKHRRRVLPGVEAGVAEPHVNDVGRLAEALNVRLTPLGLSDEAQRPLPLLGLQCLRLEQLCKQVDELDQADQDVIYQVTDSLIRMDRVKAVLTGTPPQS